MSQIVVLDGYALNPGDLSWAELQSLGPCTIHDRTAPDLVVSRACDAQIVLTNKTVLLRATLAQLPKLKYVGVMATGYNVVDVEAAKSQGIAVTNVPAYSTMSVAQVAFAHLLNLSLHVGQHAEGVRGGQWTASPDFAYWDWPLVELDGLTLGLVGFGQIGRAMARIARAFGMKVLVATRTAPATLPEGVELCDLDRLFAESDAVSLHCPLTPETTQLVNARRLEQMKPTAFLINTGRGGLVDEAALADALNQGRIAGAGVDVLSTEPPQADNPLLSARNCHITPHFAWATTAARKRLMAVVVANVRAFLAGTPHNIVGK